MDGEHPAAGGEAQNAGTQTTTPTAIAAPEAPISPASGEAQPSTSAPKPDIASILAESQRAFRENADFRRELLKDPEFQKELDHRVSSEAGRRAKAELERIQREQEAQARQYQARAEREKTKAELLRLQELDEYEAGMLVKQKVPQQLQDIEHREQEEALRAQLQPLRNDLELQVQQDVVGDAFSAVFYLAQEAGATEEELGQLNPRNYASLRDYLTGAVKLMGTKEGKKLAKEMAKVEAQALIEEQHAKARQGSAAPEALPPGTSPQTDTDFTAEYAAGRSNNTARQLEWMRRNGIPV